MLAACDPQSTFPIDPQSGAAEPAKQERAVTGIRNPGQPSKVAAQPAPAVRADPGEAIAVEPVVTGVKPAAWAVSWAVCSAT